MTDGILLAETQTDPLLKAYDTLIIDEAHERSLNIDFLAGLPAANPARGRPDLKVIVTSATIDADRFAKHFAGTRRVGGKNGQTETVRPGAHGERAAPSRGACAGGPLKTLSKSRDYEPERRHCRWRGRALGQRSQQAATSWCFLPGEREIREAADHLRAHLSQQQPRVTQQCRQCCPCSPA